MARQILVVGSANLDLVFEAPTLPVPGQTVLGNGHRAVPGGKGANQAVAIGRLGGLVSLVGLVGDDEPARMLRRSLAEASVDLRYLGVSAEVSTGVAGISIDSEGQNCIIVVPGANGHVRAEHVRRALEETKPQVVLTQLEIPLEAVKACLGDHLLILNPAPYLKLGEDVLACVDVITPNETEVEGLTGIAVKFGGQPVLDACFQAAHWLHEKGVKGVVITLGDAGCFVSSGGQSELLPAPTVSVVDTTAAGDAFNGALAVALANGADLFSAAQWANAYAALATTKAGAQESMASLVEFTDFANTLGERSTRASAHG